MSFNADDESRENLASFRDQLDLLQHDLVMARTLVRKDFSAAISVLKQMKKRIDYTLENY